ncbi:hypothetical protein NDN08_004101 [Rhodosorus marinus]|uniref:Uncharacterized protein n=1 Tax=Rhodosorus marinus TaxID=101924 RepID=A0AAV8UL47_9RHOD|nr:hypothetical protein NDN08_004101 [Rhodosorus marinus]
MAPADSIPAYYIWIYWINPIGYYSAGVLKAVVTGVELVCTANELSTFPFPVNDNATPPFPDYESIPSNSTKMSLNPFKVKLAQVKLVLSGNCLLNVTYFSSPGEYQTVTVNATYSGCQVCPITSEDDLLKIYGVPGYSKWVSAGALAGLTLFS